MVAKDLVKNYINYLPTPLDNTGVNATDANTGLFSQYKLIDRCSFVVISYVIFYDGLQNLDTYFFRFLFQYFES